MRQMVKVIEGVNEDYRNNPGSWSPTSMMVMALAKLVTCNPENIPATLALFGIPNLKEQASATWLSGGNNSGVAKALYSTSEFLKRQHKVGKLQKNYGRFVTDKYVNAAMK